MHDEGLRRPAGPGWKTTAESETTVPVGPRGEEIFNPPDRFGRMRPTVNPYAGRIENNPILPGRTTPGANIGGGWNLYEGGPEPTRGRGWEWMNRPGDNFRGFPLRGGGGGGGMDSGSYLSRFGGGLGNQFARNAGANGMLGDMLMAEAGPGMDDDYGPFIPRSVLEMDIEGIGYDPADEYDYDRKRGYPGYIWGSPPVYSARGGIIS